MGNYKRLLCFAIGLFFTTAIGALNAVFMTPATDWFQHLYGMAIQEKFHALSWLFIYLLQACSLGNFLFYPALRKKIWQPVTTLLADSLWCFAFFRLHTFYGSALLMTLVLFACFLSLSSLSFTKLFCFPSALLCAWHLYLFAVNLFLWCTNYL